MIFHPIRIFLLIWLSYIWWWRKFSSSQSGWVSVAVARSPIVHLYMFFLDWQKCYDRIHHDRLLHALKRFGLPEHYLKVIGAIYSKLTFFVRDAWGSSSMKTQEEGMRQGDPLPCLLLVILMTIIMLDARERYDAEYGVTTAERKTWEFVGFDDVEYADDSNSHIFFQTHFITEMK